MPRSTDFSVESPATVEQIRWAFAEEEYWRARLTEFGGGRLHSLTIDADGAVTVVVIYELGNDGLPGLVAKFHPLNWQVVQTETWSPVDRGRVRGEVRQEARGAPGSGLGIVVLAPAKKGSRMKCSATVEFKIPVVGGKIEGLMCRQLAEQTAVIQRFTAGWIDQHA
ncbi:DUF2505 domain-containing protein [Mycolicibacterium sp.]|uniref:DUF2505 domain-containing protein n=1 Tax=Mycolicibacterium sp. TaxID=2320850 RepID=UPI001A1BC229|nr:DUF2505 domain-containing protein [Mycolicibacterium sp.]MBJ7341377.1 DUF2505 domain-containing protein [Mycolicibacterium sp.]